MTLRLSYLHWKFSLGQFYNCQWIAQVICFSNIIGIYIARTYWLRDNIITIFIIEDKIFGFLKKKDWAGTKVNHRDLYSSLTFRNFLLSLEKEIHILRIEENKEKQNKMSHTKRTKKCFPQPNEKDKNCIRKLLALFSRVEAFFFSHTSSEWSWPPCQHLTQYWFLRWKCS